MATKEEIFRQFGYTVGEEHDCWRTKTDSSSEAQLSTLSWTHGTFKNKNSEVHKGLVKRPLQHIVRPVSRMEN